MKTLKITEEAYERLLDFKVDLQKSLKKTITFSEAIGIATMQANSWRYEKDEK